MGEEGTQKSHMVELWYFFHYYAKEPDELVPCSVELYALYPMSRNLTRTTQRNNNGQMAWILINGNISINLSGIYKSK